MRVSLVRAYLQLVRLPNLLLAAAGVFVGSRAALSGAIEPAPWRLAVAAIAAMFLTVMANAWNDAADVEIDRTAHPERPVPMGRISVTAARRTAIAGAVLGIAAAAVASPGLGLVSVAVVALMVAYSPWLKRAGLPGNLTVAALASLPFLYGAAAWGGWMEGLVLAVWAFPLHLAREIAKDLDDAAGDAAHRRTVPVAWGPAFARVLVVGPLICFLLPLPFLRSWRGLQLAMLPAAAAIGFAAAQILRGRAGAPTTLKAAMVLAMLALLAGLTIPALKPLVLS